jgi:hypothetical protein
VLARITEIPYMKEYVLEIEGLYCVRDGRPIIRYDDGSDVVDFCEKCGIILKVRTEGDEKQVISGLKAILSREGTNI